MDVTLKIMWKKEENKNILNYSFPDLFFIEADCQIVNGEDFV